MTYRIAPPEDGPNGPIYPITASPSGDPSDWRIIDLAASRVEARRIVARLRERARVRALDHQETR